MATPDYRITIRAKNNRILQRIESLGYRSMKQFCEANSLNYGTVARLVSLAEPALKTNAEWKKVSLDLSAALKCDVADLFTPRQAAATMNARAERRLMESQLLSLGDVELLTFDPEPDEEIDRKQFTKKLLATLTPRQERVIRLRYGIGCSEHTLEECGEQLGVSRDRVRQIEAKALRQMRHKAAIMKGADRLGEPGLTVEHVDELSSALSSALHKSSVKKAANKQRAEQVKAFKAATDDAAAIILAMERKRIAAIVERHANGVAQMTLWPGVEVLYMKHLPAGVYYQLKFGGLMFGSFIAPHDAPPKVIETAINEWAATMEGNALTQKIERSAQAATQADRKEGNANQRAPLDTSSGALDEELVRGADTCGPGACSQPGNKNRYH